MSRFVRPSKYRHTFVNQPRREYCYEGVKVRNRGRGSARTRTDLSLCIALWQRLGYRSDKVQWRESAQGTWDAR